MSPTDPQRPRLLGLPDLPDPPARPSPGPEGPRPPLGPRPVEPRRFDLRRALTPTRLAIAMALMLVAAVIARRPSWPEGQARQAPVQTETSRASFVVGDHTLTPVAEYTIEAVVVDTYRYRFGGLSGLSPWDVGMAWGTAADPDVLSRLSFSYNSRFLYWRVRGGGGIAFDPDELADQIANVHIIPATPAVRRAVGRLGAGDVVRMQGALVNAFDANGGEWITSRTRTDRGAGACEIFYVERVDRL